MRRPSRVVIVAVGAALIGLSAATGIVVRTSHSADKRVSTVALLRADAPPGLAPTATTTPPAGSRGIAQATGTAPGLYGGVRGQSSCDTAALINSLTRDPGLATRWAAAQHVRPQDVRPLIDFLTPALVRVDTRVTDYTRSGHQQAVIQAGTAVLIDRGGYPRVRCASGDALGRPRPVASHPRYVGAGWTSFDPARMITVGAGTGGSMFVLVDVNTGAAFARIPGSSPLADIDRPADPAAVAVAEPGASVAITSRNWPPGAAITVTFDDPGGVLAAGTADGGGNVRLSIQVPTAARPGPHQVSTSGGAVTVKQAVYVIPPAPATFTS